MGFSSVVRLMGLIAVIWQGLLISYGNSVDLSLDSLAPSTNGKGYGILEAMKNCPVGHFECAIDDSLCVPQSSICNNKPDCPDASDEKNCDNHHDKNFWDSLFFKRPGEETEEMDDVTCQYKPRMDTDHDVYDPDDMTGGKLVGKVSEDSRSHGSSGLSPAVDADWAREWEQDCQCYGEKLFCQNLQAANLTVLPGDVEFLDLGGSRVNLKEFTASTNFFKLEALVLSNCFIEQIPPHAFNRLTRLKTLHLTSNTLRSIPSGTFADNRNLYSLFVGYNQITSLQSDSFIGLTSLRELDLRHNRLSVISTATFAPLKSLHKLHLNHNEMKYLPEDFSKELSGLEMLSLSANSITHIRNGAFENMTSLKGLYLSWNHLSVLQDGVFCNMHSLLNLNLKDNEIVHINAGAFSCLDHLESLNLENNRFGELRQPRLIFDNLTKLRHIYFDQFWMCWWSPHVRFCEPKGDGISSVDNLLDNIILRSCVWIMGLTAVAGNLFVIVSRMVLREPNRVHSFYIKNLAFADLLMGVFLLSIAVHDVKFRGEFLARQHSWRHSLTCQLSGVLSTLSSEASVLILTLITLDRYLSIVRPFAAERSRASIIPALAIVSFLWVLSFSLSYLPLSGLFFEFFGSNFYSTNGLCLPLNIHNPYDPAWEYSFVLFVVINSSAFSFICFAYWKMLRIIQSSSLTIRSTQEKQDTLLAKRFGLVVLTDFLCWAPVIIGKALAMAGVQIPSTMYAWLAVFVLPVNSALNPILYTMTTKLFKQQMSKLTAGFRKSTRRSGQFDESTASMSIFYRNRTQRTLTSSFGSSLRRSSVKTSVRRMNRNSVQGRNRLASPHAGNGTALTERVSPTLTNSGAFPRPPPVNVMTTSMCDDGSNLTTVHTLTPVVPLAAEI